jgi:hypothetical protein
MTDGSPIACSLGSGDLQRRLGEIAKLGSKRLVAHEVEGGRHLLRFRESAQTRRRLEAIIAAESECCSFLDLSLTEDDGELLLSITAPEDAQPIADQLAAAFHTRPA